MARLTRKHRQDIIQDYLGATRRNLFRASEFVEWIKDRPDHPAYNWFEWDDTEAAKQFRVEQARAFVSDLRVTFTTEEIRSGNVHVISHEAPLMFSPADNRRGGGGYLPLDQANPDSMNAFCEEAARSLDAWCRRYEAALLYRGGDTVSLQKLIETLKAKAKAA